MTMSNLLGAPHLHLCLSCQAPYTIYYNGENEPDMFYKCHCGRKRKFGKLRDEPKTIDELASDFHRQLQTMLEPFVKRAIEIIESKNKEVK